MPKITIRVELTENDYYTLRNVKVCQVPRIGELVDLGDLVGISTRRGQVPVERVIHPLLHPLSLRRVVRQPMIVLKESDVTPQVLSKIRDRWLRYEATYCRRESRPSS